MEQYTLEQFFYKCSECGFVNATSTDYGPLIQNMTCAVCEQPADRYIMRLVMDGMGGLQFVAIK